MKLNPKYFNPFLAVVALLAIGLIAFFTINSQRDKKKAFRKQIVQQDSLQTVAWPKVLKKDSLRIADFDHYVLLQFWSEWSENPADTHQQLAAIQYEGAGKLTVISAMVGFRKQEAINFAQKQDLPIHFVAGSKQFSSFGIPGLPTYLLYNPDKEIQYIQLGQIGKTQIDSIKAIVNSDGQ